MEYLLKLNQQEVQIIINALGELPLKIASSAFTQIQKQVTEQDEKSAAKISINL